MSSFHHRTTTPLRSRANTIAHHDKRHGDEHVGASLPPSSDDNKVHQKQCKSVASPSRWVIILFIGMCSCSSRFIVKIHQLRGNSIGPYRNTHSTRNHPLPTTRSFDLEVVGNIDTETYPHNPLERLNVLELELETLLKQPVKSCTKALLERKANSYDNTHPCPITKHSDSKYPPSLVIYNPSIRDKFLCNNKIKLGPKKMKLLSSTDMDHECWKTPVATLMQAHSFPFPPTVANRGEYPGIVIQAMPSKTDDTFTSTNVASKTLISRDTSSSNYCDVRCYFEQKGNGVGRRYVYGTDWEFTMSMEGEVSAVATL